MRVCFYSRIEPPPLVRYRAVLPSKPVESPALPLKCVYDIQGRDGLASGVLCVRHRIANDILQEDLQNASSLLINETSDALDAPAPRQSSNCWLGNALDVVSANLAMALCAALTETLATLATSTHNVLMPFCSRGEMESGKEIDKTFMAHTKRKIKFKPVK